MRKLPCILVVDDDEDHRYLTCTELNRLPTSPLYRIQEAAGGPEALERIRRIRMEGSPVLVLCDYRMPGMSGADLIKTARRNHPNDPICFVLQSSSEQFVEMMKLQSEADRIVVKPMDLTSTRKQLQQLVEEWLESFRKRTPPRLHPRAS